MACERNTNTSDTATAPEMLKEYSEVSESMCAFNRACADGDFIASLYALNDARAEFCRFLANIYLYELTEDQIESFAHVRYRGNSTARDGKNEDAIENGEAQFLHGYALIAEYLRHRSHATAQILKVDYAHTFLGAGIYDRVLAPPYESVFTSKEHLLMQDARDKALVYYRSEGLDLPEDNTTPEDHLGFELQFAAQLIDRSTEALKAKDADRFTELILKQRGFLKYHQENWLPIFCDAIDEHCQTDFYHGIAELTRGYLASERCALDDIASEFNIGEDEAEMQPLWWVEDKEAS